MRASRPEGPENRVTTAGVLVIGNEILSGKVEEENARFLIRELYALGIKLTRVVFVRDDPEQIARDVREMALAFDVVFTAGGIGPTHDDLTIASVARAFDLPLVEHPEARALLALRYGDPPPAALLRMALLPEGTVLTGSSALKFPIVKVKNVYVFPGVPSFLRAKFEHLRDTLRDRPFVLRQIFLSVGEHQIAELLTETAARFPELELGSYPRFDEAAEYKVKVTVEGRDGLAVERGARALLERLDAAWVLRVE